MSRDPATLLDIAAACRQAIDFLQGRSKAEARQDALLRSAVLYQLLVIGEAVKRLSDAFRDAHPAIPWKAIGGMRDRLIHGYDRIDDAIVWDAVTKHVPDLLLAIEPLLPQEPTDA